MDALEPVVEDGTAISTLDPESFGEVPQPEGFGKGKGKKGKGKGKWGGKGKWDGKGKGKWGGWDDGPEEMFKQMMMMMMAKAVGKGMSAPAAKGSSDVQWKQELNQALQKHSIADKPEYTSSGEGKLWMGTVTIEGQIYNSEEAAPNKKAAENEAAKAALKELYPEAFEKASSKSGSGANAILSGLQQMLGGQTEQKGQKRKRGDDRHPGNDDPKQKLLNMMQLYVHKKHERNLASDDISWVVQEFEEGKKTFQCSLTLTVHEPRQIHTGEVCDTKKAAEWSAATIALEHLKDIFSSLEEEHKAKKAKKNADELAKLKEKAAQRKAEKEAAKAEKEVAKLDTA